MFLFFAGVTQKDGTQFPALSRKVILARVVVGRCATKAAVKEQRQLLRPEHREPPTGAKSGWDFMLGLLNFIIQGGIFRKRVIFLGYRGVSPKHTEQHSLAKSMFTLSQSQSDTSSCEV